MRTDSDTQTILTVVAALLAILTLRPVMAPAPAQAQSGYPDLYIEPGYTAVRKPDGTAPLKGKIMIDRRTGDIRGFPTLAGSPYPIDSTSADPPVSKPIYLGRFDFSNLRRVR